MTVSPTAVNVLVDKMFNFECIRNDERCDESGSRDVILCGGGRGGNLNEGKGDTEFGEL